MIVLDLCKELCPEKIPVKTTQSIGDGADGEVFGILNEPNKVIKYSIIYNRFDKSPQDIYQQDILPVVDYILHTQPYACASIYQHGYMGEYSRPMPYWNDGNQTFVIHYCIMERLFSLSEDEKKVFYAIVSHEDVDLISTKVSKILQDLVWDLDFDLEMISVFCENLRSCKLNHNDLHPRNIMKNKNGQFKLVDFDRITLEK